jgi:hypothetical protein
VSWQDLLTDLGVRSLFDFAKEAGSQTTNSAQGAITVFSGFDARRRRLLDPQAAGAVAIIAFNLLRRLSLH